MICSRCGGKGVVDLTPDWGGQTVSGQECPKCAGKGTTTFNAVTDITLRYLIRARIGNRLVERMLEDILPFDLDHTIESLRDVVALGERAAHVIAYPPAFPKDAQRDSQFSEGWTVGRYDVLHALQTRPFAASPKFVRSILNLNEPS